jgi:hypothetical protein
MSDKNLKSSKSSLKRTEDHEEEHSISRASSGAGNSINGANSKNASRASLNKIEQPQPSRTNSKANSVQQNGNQQRADSQNSHNNAKVNSSQASLRSTKSEVLPFIDDTQRCYSTESNDRDLINKSRNGYIGAVYISDVKEYFEHPSFDANVSETNKKYLEDLLSDFRKLLKTTIDNPDDTLHDVEFVEEGSDQALPGHSQLLTARSATFEALFKKFEAYQTDYLGFKLLEVTDGIKRIQLPAEGPKLTRDLMEASLHYMYWGNIDERLINRPEKLEAFFEVASFLDLKELRRHLAAELFNYLKTKASGSLAIKYLKLSVKCGCKYLRKETIDYIVRFKASILKSESWSAFVDEKENKELVKEIYQRMVEKSNV